MKGKKTAKLMVCAIGLFLIVAVIPGMVYAVPETINYQGYLTNASGNPVPNGAYDIVFAIYDIDVGGTAQWTEEHSTSNGNPVTVTNGIFSVILGDPVSNPIDALCLESGDCYLGVKVGTDGEMTPRQKLTSVAYSIKAGEAESAISVQNVTASTDDPDNTFVGVNAGPNTTGSYNTFMGNYAGNLNDTGGYNTFVGYSAGINNDTGNNNIFIGKSAGYSNTTASRNNFIGTDSGFFNTTGDNNTVIGYSAGYNLTTGYTNTFIGNYAGKGDGSLNTGIYNTFVGNSTGFKNTSGGNNAFVGTFAGFENTTGSFNTFIGKEAGYWNNTGSLNTSLGYQAGYYNSGTGNVFLGYLAGYNELGSDKLYIDNSNTSSPLIWGDFASDILAINGNVGIGTNDPGTTRLVVAGKANISGETTPGDPFEELLNVWNSGDGVGGNFVAEGPQGAAVRGWANSTESDEHFGGDFSANGPNGIGVRGHADGENGQGVLGFTSNINGRGVAGLTTDTIGTGNSYGGWFRADHTNSIAVYGLNYEHPTTITYGYLGGGQYGAYGEHGSSGNYGYLGGSDWAGYFSGNLHISGNVGIGTTSPSGKLDVNGSIDLPFGLLEVTNTGLGPGIRISDTGGDGIQIYNAGSNGLYISGSGTNGMLINNSGGNGIRIFDSEIGIYSVGTNRGIDANSGNMGGYFYNSSTTKSAKIAWGNYGLYSDGDIYNSSGNVQFENLLSGTGNSLVIDGSGNLGWDSSDRRLKTNVENIEDALEMVKKLQGVRFNWKEGPEGKDQIGLIAQDAEKVIPELTFTNPVDGYMGINYSYITAVLIEAVKEQQQIIEELKKSKTAEIESLRNQLTHLQSLVETVVAQR